MTLRFTCLCGNPLATRDDRAGQGLRCPACGRPVTVPAPGGPDSLSRHDPTPPPRRQAATAGDRFACTCGQSLRAWAGRAGHPAKCPKCGQAVVIPEPAAAFTLLLPTDMAPAEAEDEWGPDDEDQAPRPAPRPTASQGRWLAGLFVLLLLTLGVLGVAYRFSGSARVQGPAQAFAPADATDFRLPPDSPEAMLQTPPPPGRALVKVLRPDHPGLAVPVPPGPKTARGRQAGLGMGGMAFGPMMPGRETRAVPDHIPLAAGDPDEAWRLVPTDAVGLVALRVAAWWNGDFGRKLRGQFARAAPGVLESYEARQVVPLAEIDRAVFVFPSARLHHFWAAFVTARPYDPVKLLASQGARSGSEVEVIDRAGRVAYVLRPGLAYYFVNDRVLVLGPRDLVEQVLIRQELPPAEGPLSPALREPGPDQVLAAFAPSARAREVIHAALEPDARAYEPLLDVELATLRANLGGTLQVDLHGRFGDEAAAESAVKALQAAQAQVLKLLDQFAPARPGPARALYRQLLKPFESAFRQLPIRRAGNSVQVRWQADGATAALALGVAAPLARRAHESAAHHATAASLQRLVHAMHDYHEYYRHFPPAATYKGDQPLLSWRVALLESLGYGRWYRQFRLDEPWDSPHNLKLLPNMPVEYAPANMPTQEPYHTYYQVFVGPGAPFAKDRAPRLGDFTDGLDKTFLIVEGRKAVPWTKPDDVPFGAGAPRPALGGQFPGVFFAALADSRVMILPRAVDDATLRALITPAGGEKLGPTIFPPAPDGRMK
jgi:hypothetical protein